MTVNGQFINTCGKFGWDGCHKIYIAEDLEDVNQLKKLGYIIFSICELPRIWDMSCELRFIRNNKITKCYVQQYEDAVFNNQIEEQS